MSRTLSAKAVLAFAVVGFALATSAPPASAAVFTVDRTDDVSPIPSACTTAANDCSLRGAISAANTAAGADDITFAVNGPFQLALAGNEDANATGDLDITQAAPLTIIGGTNTIVDANDIDRVFQVLAGSVTMTRVTIRNGTAPVGGGLVVSGASASLVLTDSTVSDNTAETNGGGVQIDSGTMTLTNVTVSTNTVTAIDGAGGGGIVFFGGSSTLTNVTVANNTINTTTSTAGKNISRVSATAPTARNTIIANGIGPAGFECGVVASVFSSHGTNLSSDNSCGFDSDAANPDTADGDWVNTDPLLDPLADNGGPTHTHALQSNSPAIDRGTDSGCPATDQRGVTRPQDGNNSGSFVCDIGAFELQGLSGGGGGGGGGTGDGGGGGGTGGGANDNDPPRLDLTVKDQDASGKVKVRAECDEDCRLKLTGSVKPQGEPRGKLRQKVLELDADEAKTIKLKLREEVRQDLKQADEGKAKVAGTATDDAGNVDRDKDQAKLN